MLTMSKRSNTKPAVERVHFITEWLEKADETQFALASAVGVSPSTVTKWCKKGAMPTNENLIEIAKFLRVMPNDLFHDPEKIWLKRKLDGQTRNQILRIKAILDAAVPNGEEK